jgi:hypothetical protein
MIFLMRIFALSLPLSLSLSSLSSLFATGENEKCEVKWVHTL